MQTGQNIVSFLLPRHNPLLESGMYHWHLRSEIIKFDRAFHQLDLRFVLLNCMSSLPMRESVLNPHLLNYFVRLDIFSWTTIANHAPAALLDPALLSKLIRQRSGLVFATLAATEHMETFADIVPKFLH